MQATSKSPNNQKHYGIETKHQPHTYLTIFTATYAHTNPFTRNTTTWWDKVTFHAIQIASRTSLESQT